MNVYIVWVAGERRTIKYGKCLDVTVPVIKDIFRHKEDAEDNAKRHGGTVEVRVLIHGQGT